jgi:hypothetical protein
MATAPKAAQEYCACKKSYLPVSYLLRILNDRKGVWVLSMCIADCTLIVINALLVSICRTYTALSYKGFSEGSDFEWHQMDTKKSKG